jgi:hypothetical protein
MYELKLRSPIAAPRRGNGTLLPASLVALLAAMLMLQLLLTSNVELPPAGPVGGGGAHLRSPHVALVAVPAAIATRSIFAPRHAGGPAAPSAVLGGAVVAGTVRIGGRAYAVVQTNGCRTVNLPVGGMLGEWRLAALSSTGAWFVRGGERIEVGYGALPQPQASGNADNEQEAEEQ